MFHLSVSCFAAILCSALITSTLLMQCLSRRAWRRDRMKGRVNQHNLPIKNSYNKKKRDLICIQTNAEKNVRLRVASSTDNQPDASAEAIMRHEMKKFYPKLQLQTQSITNDNYKTVKSRFNITKHPATEPMIPDRPICTNNVTFDDNCLVYLVYQNDICRGEVAESEKNTLDEPLDKSQRNSNKQGNQNAQLSQKTSITVPVQTSHIVPSHAAI